MDTRAQRIIGSLVLMVVAAALFAGIGQAATRPDDRSGLLGVGRVTAQTAAAVRPDDRARPRGPGAIVSPQPMRASVWFDDREGLRGTAAVETAQPTSSAIGDGGGFRWTDAVAATGFILLLGLFAAVLVYNGRLEKRAA